MAAVVVAAIVRMRMRMRRHRSGSGGSGSNTGDAHRYSIRISILHLRGYREGPTRPDLVGEVA